MAVIPYICGGLKCARGNTGVLSVAGALWDS